MLLHGYVNSLTKEYSGQIAASLSFSLSLALSLSLSLSLPLPPSLSLSFSLSHAHKHTHTHTQTHEHQASTAHTHLLAVQRICHTGWQRHVGCLKLQVIFRKRATKYRALLRKMTCRDMASYDSTPPCINTSTHTRSNIRDKVCCKILDSMLYTLYIHTIHSLYYTALH